MFQEDNYCLEPSLGSKKVNGFASLIDASLTVCVSLFLFLNMLRLSVVTNSLKKWAYILTITRNYSMCFIITDKFTLLTLWYDIYIYIFFFRIMKNYWTTLWYDIYIFFRIMKNYWTSLADVMRLSVRVSLETNINSWGVYYNCLSKKKSWVTLTSVMEIQC